MHSYVCLATAIALLFPAVTAAQQRHTPAERYRMFQEYLVRRAGEVTRNSLSGVKAAEDWRRERPEARRRILYNLGLDPMPEKTPLNARVTSSFERDGYRVENVVFESMPGLYVTGNLYIPAELKGRAPTVVYVSGHAPGPWGAKVYYQHHGIWFARNGYVALLLDTVEFGEVPGIHHGTHDLGMWYWHSLGFTPAGPEVWNAIRAFDYLETRPEVDAKRVGITGISGGGAITWYTAAVDERFQAAATVCGSWTVGQHAALDAVKQNCDCIYFVNGFQDDLPTVGALIAPRPFKILSASRDSAFPQGGYKEAYQLTRRIYDLLGAGDRIAEFEADARHEDIPAFRKEAYEWLNHWLKKDATPFEEGEIRREEPAALTVLDRMPVNPLNGRIHRRFVKTAELRPWPTLEAWQKRRAELAAEIRDKSLRGFPAAKVPFQEWRNKEGGWTSRYTNSFNVEFTTEEGIRVNGQLFVPRKTAASFPALIYFKGAGDVIYPVDYDPLLPAFTTHVVLVLHPRAVDYPDVTNYKMSNIRMTAALLGATVESMQLWDLLRSLDYLEEAAGVKLNGISVYGRKDMGALALYGAALDPRITRVIVDDPPASHWLGAPLLNILRVTDLAEAAGMVAPREIVSLTRLPADFAYTASIYALHGRKDAIRQADDLGEALKVWEHQ
jgi:cephalosporin-C deacetylase-like acetyl esterase